VTFKGLATQRLGWVFDTYGEKSFDFVKKSLPRADMKIPIRTYMSMVFLASAISFVAAIAAVNAFIFALGISVHPVVHVTYSLFIPAAAGMGAFVIGSLLPSQRAGNRRKNIETNLPFVLTHMGAVAESGVSPYVIFKLISEFEEYGEVSREMKKVVRNVESFGLDPLTAVREVADRTPSESLKQILLGFISTTSSGGNIKIFLKNAGEQALFEWRIRREKFLQQLSAYAEFYTGILIAAPLFIIALFAVMNLIQPDIGGFDILTLTQLSIYLLIPVVNMVFLMFLRTVEVEI
jgi:flagellar protein FlaJ